MTNETVFDKTIAETLGKVRTIEVTDNPTDIGGKKYQHLVCMRVEDMPIPAVEAKIENCPKCSSRIWVSHKSPTHLERICYHCLLPTIANEQEIVVGISTKAARRIGFID